MQQILKPSMLGRVSVLLAIFFFIFSLKEFVEEWSVFPAVLLRMGGLKKERGWTRVRVAKRIRSYFCILNPIINDTFSPILICEKPFL